MLFRREREGGRGRGEREGGRGRGREREGEGGGREREGEREGEREREGGRREREGERERGREREGVREGGGKRLQYCLALHWQYQGNCLTCKQYRGPQEDFQIWTSQLAAHGYTSNQPQPCNWRVNCV